jgi:6-pyruvoyltetrahydropterin/6-carboxytetrahydropterin synthase
VIALTRRYAFPAAHALRHPSFSEAENRRVYGKCANPGGHGLDPDLLDEIFEENIGSRFSHRLLNNDPIFQERVPTAENFAEVIYAGLAEPVAERSTARVVGVRIVETRRNSFSYGDYGDPE